VARKRGEDLEIHFSFKNVTAAKKEEIMRHVGKLMLLAKEVGISEKPYFKPGEMIPLEELKKIPNVL